MKKIIILVAVIFLILIPFSCSDSGSEFGYVTLSFSAVNYAPDGVTEFNSIIYIIVNASDHTEIITSGNIIENNESAEAVIELSDLPEDNLVHVLVCYDANGNFINDTGDPFEWYDEMFTEAGALDIDLSQNKAISISFDNTYTF